MSAPQPLLTIGLPVYNGCRHIKVAVESLLALNHGDFELLISDNCSTDGTSEICRELAARHPRVRYWRNDENIGVIKNFRLVLERAQGKYFMWAAHDDRWNQQYVELLLERIEEHPEAVLATPTTFYLDDSGRFAPAKPDRAAPGDSRADNLKVIYEDGNGSWLYGIFRTRWLQSHIDELYQYPLWGGDVVWLIDIAQRFEVVGHQEAFFFKRKQRTSWTAWGPRGARGAVVFWSYMTWYTCRNAWRNNESLPDKLRGVRGAARFVYRNFIRRPSLVRTAWRVTRISILAAVQTIPWAIGRMIEHKSPPAQDSSVAALSIRRRAA
jgi:glycosyltransferase involved in cell wall biosynthesis